VYEHTDADDIRDGVHFAYLVEMDLRDRHAMSVAFGFRDYFIYRDGVLLDGLGEGQAAD
jgi:hypothetical protein